MIFPAVLSSLHQLLVLITAATKADRDAAGQSAVCGASVESGADGRERSSRPAV